MAVKKKRTLLAEEYRMIRELAGQVERRAAADGIGGDGARPALCVRLESLLEWYFRKASFCKYSYFTCSVLASVIPLAVSIVNTVWTGASPEARWLPATVSVLSALTCLISGWMALSRCQENWIRYRDCAEKLKGEAAQYLGGIGPYEPWDPACPHNAGNDRLLAERIEGIARQENESWSKMRSSKQKTPQEAETFSAAGRLP